jgi:threonine dehydrogenase-like Zn-dependent dehydrogenase
VECGRAVAREWQDRLVFAFQPHASHFVACATELLPLPENVSPETAALLPNMETAVNLVMDGAPLLGERVCVLGQGVIGLLTTALVANMSPARLDAFDRIENRRAFALEFGAHAAHDSANLETPDHDADLTYELTGNPEALNLALRLTGFGGRIVIGSWYGEKRAALDLGGSFHRSRIRLISSQVSTLAPELSGRWTKARRMNAAWQMLERVNVGRLITHRIPLEHAATAYTMLDTEPDRVLQVMLIY